MADHTELYLDLLLPKYPLIERISLGNKGRLIAIGDVHGCLDELESLLDLVHPEDEDHVVFLGDLVDRGPKSVQTVNYIQKLWNSGRYGSSKPEIHVVLGNHDEKHIRYRRWNLIEAATGRKNPMKPFAPERLAEHLGVDDYQWLWLAGQPTAYVFDTPGGERICTHAGLLPKKEWWKQDLKAFIRNRSLIPLPEGGYRPQGTWYKVVSTSSIRRPVCGMNFGLNLDCLVTPGSLRVILFILSPKYGWLTIVTA